MEKDAEGACLCSRCRTALGYLPSRPRASTHIYQTSYLHRDLYPRMPGLVQSIAATGCRFCAFILAALSSRDLHRAGVGQQPGKLGTGDMCPLNRPPRRVYLVLVYHPRSEATDQKARAPRRIIRSLWLQLIVKIDPPKVSADGLVSAYGGRSAGSFTWPVASIQGSIAPLFRIPRPIPRHALDDRCIQFILSNLQACSKNCQHSRAGHAEVDFLPTRLIDLRGTKLAVIETASLVLATSSRTGTRDSRYLTLSYCWGNAEQAKSQLKLSSVSEDRLKRGFLFGDMSLIQQDAVALTRRLGVPYLWIDALCIRQGDGADWAMESSQMHRIYAGSHATICALTSASCQEGFLARGSNPFTIKLPYYTGLYPEEDGTGPASTFEIGHSAIYSQDTPILGEEVVSAIESSRWSSRGWTFQEEIMSTRTIYFSRLGLIFACSQGTKTELGHEVRAEDNDARFMLDRISNPGSSRADLYDLWNSQVVMGYSRRQLTSPTDALPALSGLAQRFAAATGDEYVAGMWSGDLIKGLSWSAKNHPHKTLSALTRALEQEPSAAAYIAPSWSWAGCGPISFFTAGKRGLDPRLATGRHSLSVRSECDKLATATVPRGVDRFGQISRGELSLTAHTFPLGSMSVAAYSYEARPDNPAIGEYVCHREEDGISVMFTCYLDWEPSGSDQEDWARDLVLVLTGSVETAAEESGRYQAFVETDPCGLIVHPTRAGDAYLRVGTFDRAPWSILKRFLEQDPISHQRLSVECLRGYEKSEIRII